MIKTTLVGYGELYAKNIITYIERLDTHLDGYYPSILWRVFEEKGKGATLKALLDELEARVLVYHPNIVFINLSSTDMRQGSIHHMAIDIYKEVLNQILEKICMHNNRTGLNGCRPIPIVITPPPLVECPAGNEEILKYTHAIAEMVFEWHGILIDLFTYLNKKIDYKAYIQKSGVGLNQNGQDLLYDLVFLELTKLINYQGVLRERHENYKEEE